jgi:beta-1,4-mannooligosaccharide/beta-1,4-mannosyl-N-acetylglucosamine phosphorylase
MNSKKIVKRYAQNPVLSAKDIPYSSALVFNAGVTKYNGKYVMVFRNDYGSVKEQRLDGTNLGLAFSDNGINWFVESSPCYDQNDDEIRSINDPRLTVIDDACFMTFAVIGRHGIRGGIAVTEDFINYEMLHMSLPDNRNLVLFPEKINGKYYRLDRPFANYLRDKQDSFDIWISDSPDLKYWGNSELLLKAEDVPFCNDKIGPGTPPMKTEKGWLTLFHAVDVDPNRGKNGWEDCWDKRYTIGVLLLDLDDPSKIIGFSKEPLMIPEADYEIKGGFRNNVLFPCAMILEEDGEVKIYYGAADTVECLAFGQIEELIQLCSHY